MSPRLANWRMTTCTCSVVEAVLLTFCCFHFNLSFSLVFCRRRLPLIISNRFCLAIGPYLIIRIVLFFFLLQHLSNLEWSTCFRWFLSINISSRTNQFFKQKIEWMVLYIEFENWFKLKFVVSFSLCCRQQCLLNPTERLYGFGADDYNNTCFVFILVFSFFNSSSFSAEKNQYDCSFSAKFVFNEFFFKIAFYRDVFYHVIVSVNGSVWVCSHFASHFLLL